MSHTALSADSALRRSGFFLLLLLLTAANTHAHHRHRVLENIRLTFGLSASAAGVINFYRC